MGKKIVYNNISVDLSIEGTKLKVAELVLSTAESSVPTITMQVAPPKTNDIVKVTAQEVEKIFKDLRKHCAEGAKADISISMDSTEGEKIALDIKQWYAVSAGFSVTMKGSLSVELVVAHPVISLDRIGVSVGNAQDAPKSVTIAGESILEKLVSIYKALTGQATVNDPAESSEAGIDKPYDVYMTKVKEGVTNISKYLECSVDMPFASTRLENYKDDLDRTLLAYASALYDSSIWAAIVNRVLPDFQLTILPDFREEKLKIVPYEPWAEASSSIAGKDISSLVFPGVDPMPVGGARLDIYGAVSPNSTAEHYGTKKALAAAVMNEIVYLPEKAKTEYIGRIPKYASPGWFDNAQGRVAGFYKDVNVVTPNSEDGKHFSDNADHTTNTAAHLIPFYLASLDLAKQFFMARFRSQVESSLIIPFSAHDPIIPGTVTSIRLTETGNEEEGEEADITYNMYVTRAKHVISALTSQAYTEYSGVYCRTEDDIENIVAEGTKNPLYVVPDADSKSK